jgi:hypothetical protein
MNKSLSRGELTEILEDVFEHYTDCDISDEEREKINKAKEQLKELIFR